MARAAALLMIAIAGCGRVGFGESDSDGGDDGAGGTVLWVLVHPNMAPDGPGIFVVDFETLAPVGKLQIPNALTSPNALAFDGTSLWLGGFGASPAMFELDPADGFVRRALDGVETEGIAIGPGGLWYADGGATPLELFEITIDGAPLRTIATDLGVINDLATDGTSLYCAVNDESDPIVRVAVPGGTAQIVIQSAVTSGFLYALTFHAGSLYVIDPRTTNVLRQIDPASGTVVGERELPTRGSIRAIAIGQR